MRRVRVLQQFHKKWDGRRVFLTIFFSLFLWFVNISIETYACVRPFWELYKAIPHSKTTHRFLAKLLTIVRIKYLNLRIKNKRVDKYQLQETLWKLSFLANGSVLVFKRFPVQIFLWSLEFVMLNYREHDTDNKQEKR